ncbi:MAG: DUF1648 domain-containing protein [Planctomycetota bacterium]
MTALLVLSVAALWTLAVTAWPDLPAQVPTHFDVGGRPDAWSAPGFWSWFLLPTLATGMVLLMGVGLPRWVVGMARRNSSLLNMPQKARFQALPEAARVRAVSSTAQGLQRVALLVVGLFGWILYGTREVAHGRWEVLPPTGLFGVVGLLIAQSLWLVVSASRAVSREVAAEQGGG